MLGTGSPAGVGRHVRAGDARRARVFLGLLRSCALLAVLALAGTSLADEPTPEPPVGAAEPTPGEPPEEVREPSPDAPEAEPPATPPADGATGPVEPAPDAGAAPEPETDPDLLPTQVNARLTARAAFAAAAPRARAWRVAARACALEAPGGLEGGLDAAGAAPRWRVRFFALGGTTREIGAYDLLEIEVDRTGVIGEGEQLRGPGAVLGDLGSDWRDSGECLGAAGRAGLDSWRGGHSEAAGGRVAAQLDATPGGPVWRFAGCDLGPDGRRRVDPVPFRVDARTGRALAATAADPARLPAALTAGEAFALARRTVIRWRPDAPVAALSLEGHAGAEEADHLLAGRFVDWALEAQVGAGRDAPVVRVEIRGDRVLGIARAVAAGREPLPEVWLDAAALADALEENGGRAWRFDHPSWRARVVIPDTGVEAEEPVGTLLLRADGVAPTILVVRALTSGAVLEVRR